MRARLAAGRDSRACRRTPEVMRAESETASEAPWRQPAGIPVATSTGRRPSWETVRNVDRSLPEGRRTRLANPALCLRQRRAGAGSSPRLRPLPNSLREQSSLLQGVLLRASPLRQSSPCLPQSLVDPAPGGRTPVPAPWTRRRTLRAELAADRCRRPLPGRESSHRRAEGRVWAQRHQCLISRDPATASCGEFWSR